MSMECVLPIGWINVYDIQHSLSTTYICFVQLLNKEQAKRITMMETLMYEQLKVQKRRTHNSAPDCTLKKSC